MLSAEEIKRIIPHRYPFLMIDKIIEHEPGRRAVGLKNVTAGEPYFVGHFPGYPVMPGVLIVEALAQTGAIAVLSLPENRGKLVYFAGIDRLRFRKPVLPGDTLVLEVELVKLRSAIGKGEAIAKVDNEVVVEGTLTFAVSDRKPASE